jgi:DNA-binding MarR family transcriptional regulator
MTQSLSSTASKTPAAEQQALACVEVLGRLAALFLERRRQLAESVGLSDQQWQLLEEIHTEHFMPSLFAARRESSAAAVSKIIRQLIDKGFIIAEIDRADARKRSYSLTPRGQDAVGQLRASRQQAIEQVWLSFDETELNQFQDFGGTLAERLNDWSLTKA